VRIRTDDLRGPEFEHFFWSCAFEEVIRGLCIPEDKAPSPSIMVPAKVLTLPGRLYRSITFGGADESPDAWSLRDRRLVALWDFEQRSSMEALVNTPAASDVTVRVLSEVVLRSTSNRREGLRVMIERRGESGEPNGERCNVRVLWNPRGGVDAVEVDRLLVVGGAPVDEAPTLRGGMTLKDGFDQRFPVRTVAGKDLVIIVSAGKETAAAVALGREVKEGLLEGIARLSPDIWGAVGQWNRAVLRVRIVESKPIVQVFKGYQIIGERLKAIVVDDRWWGWAVKRLWVGERILLLNRPNDPAFPGFPGMPLGIMKPGDEYWIVSGGTVEGWYGVLHGERVERK
jgi:hypothetical protein